MTAHTAHNGPSLGNFIAASGDRALPPAVLDAARLCLTDWMAVAIGAGDEEAARIVRRTIAEWKSGGTATVLFGTSAAAPMAALANGTLAHCLDFDDTYVDANTHTSAPVWAATLALGEEAGADENALLSAFVTGFEVAARIGHGLGEAVTARGWHGTGVFGRLGAAAASAALLRLDSTASLHALALAATQAGGLTASFGTMAKPFHAGKAAMDGVLSAQLARSGFMGAAGILEPGGGLDRALVQDQSARITAIGFPDWRILHNSFKLYAACHLSHPSIDAALQMRAEGLDVGRLTVVRAEVSPLAAQVTGQSAGMPATALEGKFDLRYCVALALHGHELSASDFREPWRPDQAIAATAAKVRVSSSPHLTYGAARLQAELANGQQRTVHIPIARGHPGNPASWDDMGRKFGHLVTPRLGDRTVQLFDLLRQFGQGDVYPRIRALTGGL